MKREIFRPMRLAIAILMTATAVAAAPWPSWRGSHHTGVSDETGLIASWSRETGENLLWRRDFIGRSTPVVVGDRVCANGRTGTGIDRRETVACFRATTGELLWERYFNVSTSTVPFNRASWASLEADLETGYLYHQGVGGPLVCLDAADGKTVWEIDLGEAYGRFSGYGGRTTNVVAFEDLVIANVINASWGAFGPPRHRFYAFDKRTGKVVWIASPAGPEDDKNICSNPIIAEVAGRPLVISGNADGAVYALAARTGDLAWKFQLSKRGLNSTIVYGDGLAFAGHSEENVDAGTMGRLVAIDATLGGDITATGERWRIDELGVGYPSPTLHAGKLYVVDNAGNMLRAEAATGKVEWRANIGTVGKGSPVWADGRLYVTEVNGRVLIVDAETGAILDTDEIKMPDGRYAEIYGSFAIADGRLFFTSEEGIYALGSKATEVAPAAAQGAVVPRTAERPMAPPGAEPARLLVVPAEVLLEPGKGVDFEVFAFDPKTLPMGKVAATFTLAGLEGEIDPSGHFVAAPGKRFQTGTVSAKHGALEATGRVRVLAPLPWSEDFEGYAAGVKLPQWIGSGRYEVRKLEDGATVLAKPKAASGLLRSAIYLGAPEWSGYSIQADMMSEQEGRRRPDMGLINSGYTLDLMGNRQKAQLRSWDAMLRVETTIDFAWEPAVWYTVRLNVEQGAEKATVRAKIWPRGAEEPAAWTVTAEDPFPVRSGSPGLVAYSPANVYFDNVKLTRNP